MKAKDRERLWELLARRGWPFVSLANRNLTILIEQIVDRAVRKARREERARVLDLVGRGISLACLVGRIEERAKKESRQ